MAPKNHYDYQGSSESWQSIQDRIWPLHFDYGDRMHLLVMLTAARPRSKDSLASFVRLARDALIEKLSLNKAFEQRHPNVNSLSRHKGHSRPLLSTLQFAQRPRSGQYNLLATIGWCRRLPNESSSVSHLVTICSVRASELIRNHCFSGTLSFHSHPSARFFDNVCS